MYVLVTYLALVLLATPLHATVPIFLLYAAFSAVVIWTVTMQPEKTTASAPIKISWIAGVVSLFAAMRIIPFVRWGSSALGADMGVYYRNFNACFASFAECAREPIAVIGYLPYAIGLGTQAILIAIHYAANAAIILGVYRIAKNEWGGKAALWSIAVYAVSLPQFLFYWSFFLKMEIALAASLFALHAYARRQKRAALYAALAGIIHPLTIVPLAAAFFAAGIANNTKRYSFLAATTGVLATGVFKWNALTGYIGYFVSYARGTYAATEQSFLAGHFVEFSFYHETLMLFYVPFALLTITWLARHKRLPVIGWYSLASLILISVNAVFHNRFVVTFDISCVILSGYALTVFTRRFEAPPLKYALTLLLFFIAGYSLYESARMEPLIDRAEFAELLSLQNTYSGMPIFINSVVYRQFITGYTGHLTIFSPFNEEPWKSFGAPSLVYNARRSTPLHPVSDPHFTHVSERVFEYTP